MTDKPAYPPYEEGMTYVEKLDFREQAHRHEMERIAKQEAEQTKRAKYKLREARQETLQIIGIGVLVVALLLGIAYAIYAGTRPGPHSNEPSGEERREAACIENGGGWVPEDLLQESAEHGLCVFPGKAAPGAE